MVDRAAGGSGGAATGGSGGSAMSSSGPTSSSSTGGSGVTCKLACGGPVGLCGCEGPCSDGKKRAVGCGGDAGSGVSCTCEVDGQVVGTCTEPSLVCELPQSCCAAVFGL